MVAMSGGVDSAVAALLLRRRGFDVTGVTLRLWYCDDPAGLGSCCDERALRAARRTCDQLGIRHRVLDAQEPFERRVLEPAWTAYRGGRTPSPCLSCNPRVKLGELMTLADEADVRFLATGHYARLLPARPAGSDAAAAPGAEIPALLRGTDPQRDQSYFLARLRPAQLRRLLLPLGILSKEEVRRLARDAGLANADRRDSQDACLADAEGGFAGALAARFGDPPPPGDIVDADGRVVGRHAGLHRHTVGQRKGLGIALGVPAYVLRLDVARNTLVVTTDPGALHSSTLTATGARWLVPPGSLPHRVQVQHRYRSRPVAAAVVAADGDGFTLALSRPQRAITPGQAAVLYEGDRVLGAGWIA